MKHEEGTVESFNGFFKRGVRLFKELFYDWQVEGGNDDTEWPEIMQWLSEADTLIKLVDEQHRQYLAGTDDIIAGFDLKRRSVSRETETEKET